MLPRLSLRNDVYSYVPGLSLRNDVFDPMVFLSWIVTSLDDFGDRLSGAAVFFFYHGGGVVMVVVHYVSHSSLGID